MSRDSCSQPEETSVTIYNAPCERFQKLWRYCWPCRDQRFVRHPAYFKRSFIHARTINRDSITTVGCWYDFSMPNYGGDLFEVLSILACKRHSTTLWRS